MIEFGIDLINKATSSWFLHLEKSRSLSEQKKNCTTTDDAAVIKSESNEDLLRKLNEEMIETSAKHAENYADSDAN